MASKTASDDRALRRWRNAIIMAFGIGGISIATWGPRLPAIRADLAVGTATIGAIVGASTIGAVGGLLVSTPLLSRFGARRALLIAVLVIAAAVATIGAAVGIGSVVLVALGLLVLGFSIGTLDVLANVEGAAVERQAGRTLMPLMHAAWSAGAALGSGIGAACAALGISPSTQMLGLSVFVVIGGFTLTRAIPAELPADETAAAVRSRRERVMRWLRGWTDLRLLTIGVVLFGCEFGEGSANNWLSLATKQNHGQSGAVAALFFTVFAISEASTRTFAGPIVDRIGRVRMIRYTTGLGIAGVVLFILGGTVWLILPGVVLWAIGVSMGFPLGLSAAAQGGGEDAAAQVSVAASVGYVSGLVAPPTIGLLAQSLGLLGALWLIGILFLACIAAAGALAPVDSSGVTLATARIGVEG